MPRGAKPGERRGGREKGVPNKDKQELLDMILATGCPHPIEGLATVAKAALDSEDHKLAHTCLSDLAPYIAAKRKAVEITGPDGGPVEHALDAALLDTNSLRAVVSALATIPEDTEES